MIEIVDAWRLMHAAHVKDATDKTLKQMIDKHLKPYIDGVNANSVTPLQALNIIKQVNSTSSDYIANRLLAILVNAYDYANVMEWTNINPFARLQKFTPRHKIKGLAFLPTREFAQCLRNIDKFHNSSETVVNAFYTLVYTALRRSEIVAGQWQEIDYMSGIWTIPANRMKMGEAHSIALTPSVMKILSKQKGKSSIWIFPSVHKHLAKPINPAAPYSLLEKGGFGKKQTLHGIRKVFSTTANESGLWHDKLIERQLDHKPRGVAGIYDKSVLIEERRRLMLWWESKVNQWRNLN